MFLLHRALLRGGIDAAGLNRTWLEQLFKGALTHDLVALRMRMMHTLEDLPFSQLMREVREEENWVDARESAKGSSATASVSHVPVTAAAAVPHLLVASVTSELDSLRKGVKELTSLVRRLECCSCTSLTVCCRPGHRNHCPSCFH